MLQPCLPEGQTHVLLENGNVCIALEQCDRSEGIAERLTDFLSPAFQMASIGLSPDFSIIFESYSCFPDALKLSCMGDLVIRHSTADIFNLVANIKLNNEDKLAVDDPEKQTAYSVNREKSTITAFVTEKSFIHLVELIRYTALIIEESRGTTLLHASAAMLDEEAFLILGHKGAGKTTTLLRLLLGEKLDYLSGDKILLNVGPEGLQIRAWPDYPHIGIGSLRPYPAFAEACGVSFRWDDGREKPDSHKELIDPQRFRSALPGAPRRSCSKVRALLFPDIASKTGAMRKFAAGEKSLRILRENVEFPFEFTPGRWHGLFNDIARKERTTDDRLLRRLTDVPWYSVLGAVASPLPE